MNQYEHCVDCWEVFSTRNMEYDTDTDEWICDDCFEERAIEDLERDYDEP